MTTLTVWAAWLDTHRFLTTGAALGATAVLALLVLAGRLAARRVGRTARWLADQLRAARFTSGTTLLYLAALGALGNNAATSWQFVRDRVHMHSLVERSVLFGVVEFALLALTVAMRASVRRSKPGEPRRAGPAGTVAWALCGVTALAAWEVSGPVVGTVRVLCGAVLYEVLLHLALQIDRREHTGEQSTLEKLLVELRERLMSRLGLGDDERDAVTRTRDRALHRAARLAAAKHAPLRTLRLQRAVRIAAITGNPQRRDALLDEINLLKHVGELSELDWPAPWTGPVRTTESGATPDQADQATAGPAEQTGPDQTRQADRDEAADQTDPAPAVRRTATVRPLRTARQSAAEANARYLQQHYAGLIEGGELPGDRQIREELGWGGERAGKALEKLRELLNAEATA